MDVTTFQTHFPEFRDTDPTLIGAKLQEAAIMMGGPDPQIWGSLSTAGQPLTLGDVAQGNRAADLLISSPEGLATLMTGDRSKPSLYLQKYNELVSSLCVGPLVAGGGRWRP